MLNTRVKIRKTQNTKKTCIAQASIVDSNCESTESGALIGSNDDLLTEILLRLPVISIFRFKSVSKHWRSFLSDRRFTILYEKVLTSPGLFVGNLYIPFDVGNQNNSPPFRSLDFYPDRRRGIRILQSCNGLLLCCSNQGKEQTRKYYVVNPTTMQFIVIPSIIGGAGASKTICFMGLAFDQADCVHYKVVCFRKVKPKGQLFQIQIYSSDTGEWRISHESFYTYVDYSFRYVAYLNGVIYWIQSIFCLLYFKLDVEEVHKLSLPDREVELEEVIGIEWPLYFGESGGHLHMVEKPPREICNLRLKVYEMLSDHSGWFIKYKVELDELAVTYGEMFSRNQHPSVPILYNKVPTYYNAFKVFDVVRGEEEEDTFMVIRIPEKVLRYNVHDKSFKQIFEVPIDRYQESDDGHVHRYTQTLSSL